MGLRVKGFIENVKGLGANNVLTETSESFFWNHIFESGAGRLGQAGGWLAGWLGWAGLAGAGLPQPAQPNQPSPRFKTRFKTTQPNGWGGGWGGGGGLGGWRWAGAVALKPKLV